MKKEIWVLASELIYAFRKYQKLNEYMSSDARITVNGHIFAAFFSLCSKDMFL